MEKISKIKIGCKPYEVYDPSAHEKIEQITDRDVLKDIVVEAHVDDTTGTPNVAVVKGENKITLNFSGLKGESGDNGQDAVQGERGPLGPQGEQGPQGPQGPQGEPGYDGKTGKTPVIGATATYDYSVAGNQPHVHVDVDGEPEHPVFNFRFSGLRGQDGADGQDGRNGRDGYDGSDYDDSYVRGLITTEKSRIDTLLALLNSKIQSQVESLFANATWWQLHYPGDGTQGGGSHSDFGQQDVQQYLQTLGLWYTSDNATYTKWTTITQDVDNLKLEVNQLKTNQSVGGEVDYEALSGAFYTYITGETITSGLEATWARFLDPSKQDKLEWLTAAIEAKANSQQAVLDLFTAAMNNETLQSAYAGLNSRVQTIEDSYVSENNLSSSVNTALSSLFTRTSTNEAVVGMYATLDATKAEADANQSNIAALTATIDSHGSKIDALADRFVYDGDHGIMQLKNASLTVTLGGYISAPIVYATIETGSVRSTSDDLTIQVAENGKTLYLESNGSIDISASRNTSINVGNDISLWATNGIIETNQDLTVSSDETLKNIVSDANPSVESIASTRTVNYQFKDNANTTYTGAIAQDWQSVLPYTVSTNGKGKLGLNYSQAALVSAVIDAREIVKLKQENEELKQRLAAIEERLANL